MSAAKVAFEMKTIKVSLDLILPLRRMKNPHKTISRYKRILTSIKEVGLIEPLAIHPQRDKSGTYMLLDGHLRHSALKELGMTEADCIIATDDESFTYNARISRLQPDPRAQNDCQSRSKRGEAGENCCGPRHAFERGACIHESTGRNSCRSGRHAEGQSRSAPKQFGF